MNWVALVGDNGQELSDTCNKMNKWPDKIIWCSNTKDIYFAGLCVDLKKKLYNCKDIWFYKLNNRFNDNELVRMLYPSRLITKHSFDRGIPSKVLDKYSVTKCVVGDNDKYDLPVENLSEKSEVIVRVMCENTNEVGILKEYKLDVEHVSEDGAVKKMCDSVVARLLSEIV